MPPKSSSNLWESALIAALGAGIVTSFAVSQGQHPLIAVVITSMATLIALICGQLGLI